MKTFIKTQEAVGEYFSQDKERILKEFFDLLRIPSISSEEEYKEDLLHCADWVKREVSSIGFHVDTWEMKRHPTIFATHLHAGPDKPTLLIYNHYDVQPVDPLEEWDSPPFEPVMRDGEIYARGAQDNKGQFFYVLQALKFLIKRDGKLPLNVKWVIEGEEEIGSVGLSLIAQQKKKELKADYVVIVDVGLPAPDTPAVVLGIRGLITFTLEVSGSNRDLHSGSHGGIVYNPNHALIEMLASLRDRHGRVMVPGFYDDVVELSKEERQQLAKQFDKKAYEEAFGTKAEGGEKDYAPLESGRTRPTMEINGISGGYAGQGFKTVIPAKACAKISCRLVLNQNPHKIAESVKNYLMERVPRGVKAVVTIHEGGGEAVRSPADSTIVKAFSQAYSEILGGECSYMLEGGTIGVVTELVKASGGELALVGYGLADDRIHAPNEHFSFRRIELGTMTMARAMEILGGKGDKTHH